MKKISTEKGYVLYGLTSELEDQCGSEELLASITQVVASGFGRDHDPEDIRQHVFGADRIGLMYEGDTLCGFATANSMSSLDLCYLYGISVATTAKGTGPVLTRHMFEQSGMSRFGLTTQNPSMYIAASRATSTIFPNPHSDPSAEVVEIGKKLVEGRCGSPQENMVVFDLYPECLYCTIPKPKDAKLWRWWCEMIRVDESGQSKDGIVFVGEI